MPTWRAFFQLPERQKASLLRYSREFVIGEREMTVARQRKNVKRRGMCGLR
jgi:hypothetical protein